MNSIMVANYIRKRMGKIAIVKIKECRVLTWQGWILMLTVLFIIFAGFVKFIPGFLSVNKPVGGNLLILDGMMPDFAIKEAIHVFNTANYDLIVVTGGKIQTGYFIGGYKTMAELTAASLLKMGFDKEKIMAIPGGEYRRDRTYNSAVSLKKWIAENNINIKKIDVLAVGSHARRSRFLFARAMEKEYEVGIISVKDPAYNSNNWWKSSVGVRTVLSETIAYFYVLLFFTD